MSVLDEIGLLLYLLYLGVGSVGSTEEAGPSVNVDLPQSSMAERLRMKSHWPNSRIQINFLLIPYFCECNGPAAWSSGVCGQQARKGIPLRLRRYVLF